MCSFKWSTTSPRRRMASRWTRRHSAPSRRASSAPRSGSDRLHGKEQGLVFVSRRRDQPAQRASHQECGFQRQSLRGRGADQKDEGAAGAGRRSAGSAVASRTALTAAPRAATSLPDARPASLVLRLTPDFVLPFVQLARLDRPAGWQLLLAPCWQATALAGLALHRGPNLWHLFLFFIGAIAMRGAGSTFNDLIDRKIDAQVARTRAAAAVGPRQPAQRRDFTAPRRSSASPSSCRSTVSRSGLASPRSSSLRSIPL